MTNKNTEEWRKRTKAPTDTFCLLPWIHLSTRPNGHMRVCCTANASSVGATNDKKHGGEVGVLKQSDGKPANLNVTDLMSSWNNDYMKNVRKQMLNGEKPASCLKCYAEEDAGHMSKRFWETEYWARRVDLKEIIEETSVEGEIPPKIRYLDLRLGSKCNLKCIMCSPHDSSLWVPDWIKLHPSIENESLKETMQWGSKGQIDGASYNWHKKNDKFWEQLYEQIPNMKQLYFAGGEATIIEEHYTLLEEVVKAGYAKNIELRYNSNGVEMPQRLFDLWDEFKNVRFHYSVDSIGEMNDYIRFPSKWDHTVKMFHLLDNTGPNVEVTVACAVQALNIYYLPDFVKWKLEQKFKKINLWPLGAGMINYHFVYHPPHLNVKVLPNWFKEMTHAKFDKFIEWLEANWELCTVGERGKDVTYDTWREAAYGVKRLRGMLSFSESGDWSRERMPEFIEYINKMDGIRDTNFRDVFPEMAPLLDWTPDDGDDWDGEFDDRLLRELEDDGFHVNADELDRDKE
jgi:sulfatase maturation enzyme AslB (radical SAM superfamily)